MIDYKLLYERFSPVIARATEQLIAAQEACAQLRQSAPEAPDYREMFITLFSASTFSILDMRSMQRECEALYLADPEPARFRMPDGGIVTLSDAVTAAEGCAISKGARKKIIPFDAERI